MNARWMLWLSLSVNGALAALLGWLLTRARPVQTPDRPLRTATTGMTAAAADAATIPEAKPEHESPDPVLPFHWSQIASTNFALYRDQLRALGCPEATVRDIIESEVNAWFAQRRRPITDAVQRRFWDAIAAAGKDSFDSFKDAFRALHDERRELLDRILGKPARQDAVELADSRADWAREYAWLPPAEQARVFALEEEHWRKIRALETEIGDREWTAEDRARRQELDQAFQAARHDALGDQRAEFERRNSREGQWASGLRGFEATEAEWRAVTEALKMMANPPKPQAGSSQPGNPGTEAPPETAEQTRRRALETALGSERYAEYERANDGSYQQTRKVTRRLGLTDESAAEAWEIQRAATAAAESLRGNSSLEDGPRQAALTEVNAEALRSLRQVLGDQGLGVYRKYAGDWLGTLAPGE